MHILIIYYKYYQRDYTHYFHHDIGFLSHDLGFRAFFKVLDVAVVFSSVVASPASAFACRFLYSAGVSASRPAAHIPRRAALMSQDLVSLIIQQKCTK